MPEVNNMSINGKSGSIDKENYWKSLAKSSAGINVIDENVKLANDFIEGTEKVLNLLEQIEGALSNRNIADHLQGFVNQTEKLLNRYIALMNVGGNINSKLIFLKDELNFFINSFAQANYQSNLIVLSKLVDIKESIDSIISLFSKTILPADQRLHSAMVGYLTDISNFVDKANTEIGYRAKRIPGDMSPENYRREKPSLIKVY